MEKCESAENTLHGRSGFVLGVGYGGGGTGWGGTGDGAG
jgi:hypothetical protein